MLKKSNMSNTLITFNKRIPIIALTSGSRNFIASFIRINTSLLGCRSFARYFQTQSY